MTPKHLFTCSDGALYDTRRADWPGKPLRSVYRKHCREIWTAAELKATLRAGPYAWPGGYPLYFIAADGCALSFSTVRNRLREVMGAFSGGDDGWHVVACEINHDDAGLRCADSGELIPAAYV